MFSNRAAAALQLAQFLKSRHLKDPLVLAIPRGGVVIGAVLARELPAELDVVLSRKLRAPFQPELAIGAIGQFYVDFEQVEDAEVVRLLREFRTVSRPQDTGAPR